MIEAFTFATAHHFGDAFASQARLRFKTFVGRRGLPHNHYAGLEYDEFDTPAAVYFVWRDEESVVRGVVRLIPTSRPYMLKAYWPDLIQGEPLPASDAIHEFTRACIDRSLPARERVRVFPALCAAVDEFCGLNDIAAVVGVTRPGLVPFRGQPGFRWLGPLAEVEGQMERAFLMPQGVIRDHALCQRLAIEAPILRMAAPAPVGLAA